MTLIGLVWENKYYEWMSMGTRKGLVAHILQNMIFCVQQMREIHTSLEQMMAEFTFLGELSL